jgi:hypothetical protein
MKVALLLFTLLAQYPTRPPDIPAATPNPDFPLRVYLLAVRSGPDLQHDYRTLRGELYGGPGYYTPAGSFHGFGVGNLLGDQTAGFDFSFECGTAFLENRRPQEFYQARWKQPGAKLEILTQAVGASRSSICELEVGMKSHPFNSSSSPMPSTPVLLGDAFWKDLGDAFQGDAPQYPLRLHVLTSTRRDFQGGNQGYGTANLVGTQPEGFAYTYECGHGFLYNTQSDEAYMARWTQPGRQLEILVQPLGSDHIDRCRLRVTRQSLPYDESRRFAASLPAPGNSPGSAVHPPE